MHRIYVKERDTWTLASRYVERAPLPTDARRLVVYETERPPSAQFVCLVTKDGRRLCDIGVGHDHDGN